MAVFKKIVSLLFLICFLQSKSQIKIDTIKFNYKKRSYTTFAEENIKKLIDINSSLKNDSELKKIIPENLFTDSINSLKIISIPVFSFKKEILNYKEGENLISYIDFNNNVLNQEVLVLKNDENIYMNDISSVNKIDYQEAKEYLKDGYIKDGLRKIAYIKWHLDCLDLIINSDNLIFKILDDYCIVIKGRVYVIFNESVNITLSEFNIHYLDQIEIIQQIMKEKKLVYKAKIVNNPLPKKRIYVSIDEE